MEHVWRILRRPRWALFTILTMGAVALFVRLGIWQLDRHSERVELNRVLAERISLPPLDLASAERLDPAALEYRPVEVSGTFLVDAELLWRGRAWQGQPGFHVLTPLDVGGRVVVVDRGWIPLDVDPSVVRPPDGQVVVVGLARLPQPARVQGSYVTGVDPAVWTELWGLSAAPFWLQVIDGSGDRLPVPSDPPDVADTGPHLSYALQWFGFAVVSAIGFVFLLRRVGRGEPADLGSGDPEELGGGEEHLRDPVSTSDHHPGPGHDRFVDEDP